MAVYDLPIHMVTIFHPEKYFDCRTDELWNLPHIERSRDLMEGTRKNESERAGAPIWEAEFHGGVVSNNGEQTDSLRYTWVSTAAIQPCIVGLEPRLIHTKENRSQARFKLELRPSWGETPGVLSPGDVARLSKGVSASERISIRQLWRNPTQFRFGTLPIAIDPAVETHFANLMLGPYKPMESRQPADIKFYRKDDAWRVWARTPA
ncbi:MAG: hypothetical protein M3O61_10050 [Gemmatimonadota bacterium]|nr:hypothetical protein [Gemmatimonadota bacterium]